MQKVKLNQTAPTIGEKKDVVRIYDVFNVPEERWNELTPKVHEIMKDTLMARKDDIEKTQVMQNLIDLAENENELYLMMFFAVNTLGKIESLMSSMGLLKAMLARVEE